MPLYVNFGDESFRDGVDLTAREFYERLRTSDRAADDVAADAGRLPRRVRGARGVRADLLAAHLGKPVRARSRARGTAAARARRRRVRTIDTETRVGGDRDARAGDPAAARARHDRRGDGRARRALPAEHGLLFTVDTLEFLARGGRIGRAKAFAGRAAARQADPLDPRRRGDPDQARARRTARRCRSSSTRSSRRRRTSPTLRVGIAHAAAPERARRAREDGARPAAAGADRDRDDASARCSARTPGPAPSASSGSPTPLTSGPGLAFDCSGAEHDDSTPSTDGFASLDQPPAWPATPRRRSRGARLDARHAARRRRRRVKRKLAKLGLETVARPARAPAAPLRGGRARGAHRRARRRRRGRDRAARC